MHIGIIESGHNVFINWFADSTWFFGTVENSDSLNSLRNCCEEMLGGEWSVQTDLQETNFFALGIEVVNNFFKCFADGTHCDDNVFCVFSTIVVEELVVTASLLGDCFHVLFGDANNVFVVLVGTFSLLEEDIRVLVGTLYNWMFWVQTAFAECLNSIHVDLFFEEVFVHNFDLLNFVRSSETIEEVDEWHTGFDGSELSHATEIHNFLYAGGSEFSEANATAEHYIGVVTEDGQSVGSNRTSCYLENGRK